MDRNLNSIFIETMINALCDITKEACDALAVFPFPKRTWTKFVREDENTVTFPVELRPDLIGLTIILFQVQNRLAGITNLIEVIKKDPQFSIRIFSDGEGKPIDDSYNEWWILTFIIIPFLSNYFAQKKDFIFDLELFQRVALEEGIPLSSFNGIRALDAAFTYHVPWDDAGMQS
jgi:flagellar biosynthesis regulator FlaF